MVKRSDDRLRQSDEELQAEMEAAEERYWIAQETEHRAASARFDPLSRSLVIVLMSGLTVIVPVGLLECLEGKTDIEIAQDLEIVLDGYAIHWETFNSDFTIPSLMAGLFGRKPWMEKLRAELQAKSLSNQKSPDKVGIRESSRRRSPSSMRTKNVRPSRATGSKRLVTAG